ncbi:MAG: DUF3943 domain-containing protein [Treponema sp.]|nr:DUF3943 domain-containing protein [Treponema sp.]
MILASLWSQEETETGSKFKPREQNLLIDIPLTIAEDMLINLAGNGYWRLWGPDSEAAYFTADSIRNNLNPRVWDFEEGQGGDTFLTNQFIHPYAGGLYFASARSNNISFYWSILSSTFGSLTWEALGETDSPASSDLINTAVGGIVLGEILHRLYIELDKGGIAGKIGASLLSPTDRITAAIRRYGPEESPSKIRDASLALAFSWINASFLENNDEVTSWNKPSAFIGFDLVYDNPYTAHSKTPFAQFDLNTSLTLSFPQIYNFNFIADGYLASWLLADDETDQASNGLTLHFDSFVTDQGFLDLNNGRENLSFNANSLDYSVKWRHLLNNVFEFSLKTHLGFSPWAVTDYNGGVKKDDYYLYLFGGNIKLFFELQQTKEDGGRKNGHALSLSLCFYDTWNLPNTPGLDVNTLFLFSKIAYSFPLTDRFSIYVADNFLFLHIRPTGEADVEFPDTTRWYNNAQLGIKISF